MRIAFRLVCPLGLLCAAVLIPQGKSPQADSGRDSDLQAIYSSFLNDSKDPGKLHLVAPETSPTSYPHEQCLEIPPAQAANFQETRADFERRKNTIRLIPNPLLTSTRYVILDPDVAKEVILKTAAWSESPIIRDRYPGTDHLLIFSDVYFSQKRTVALVEVDYWCGGLCGTSRWTAFEKGTGGAWQRRQWAGRCIAIAGARAPGEMRYGKTIAVCPKRPSIIRPASVNFSVQMSYLSMVASTPPVSSLPPLMRTLPSSSSVEEWRERACVIAPADMNFPDSGS